MPSCPPGNDPADPERYLAPERRIYRSPLLAIGKFRCPLGHPAFHGGAVNNGNLVVFPRTSVIIEQTGARPLVADPNTAVLYNDRQEYRREANSQEGDRCEWFAFGDATVVEVMARRDPSVLERVERPFHTNHAFADRRTYLLQRQLVTYLDGTPQPDLLLVDELALRVLAKVVQRVPPEVPGRGARVARSRPRARVELANAARRLLALQYATPANLSTLAEQLSCSEYHLCRTFSSCFGTSLHRYRDQLRLRSALQWLTDTTAPLTAIALELGYSSHSHFGARFRTAFAMSPSRFRRRASGSLVAQLRKNLIADPSSSFE
ncbi:MAG: AraC family transcriptional regulator [Pseudomonadota bacterium]